MTINILGTDTTDNSSSTVNTLTVAAPSGVTYQPGDLNLWYFFTANLDAVASQQGITQQATAGGATLLSRAYVAGDPTSYTFTLASAEFSACQLLVCRSTYGVMGVDAAQASPATITTPPVNATFGSDWLVLMAADHYNTSTLNAPGGFVTRVNTLLNVAGSPWVLAIADSNGPVGSPGTQSAETFTTTGTPGAAIAAISATLSEGRADSVVMLV